MAKILAVNSKRKSILLLPPLNSEGLTKATNPQEFVKPVFLNQRVIFPYY